MIAEIGENSIKKSWQADFPVVAECSCGGEARIAFVAYEGLDKENQHDKGTYVCELHENKGKGGYWPHDSIAVAVYLCRECFNPVAKFNQA